MIKRRYWKNWKYPKNISVDELLQNKRYLADRNKLFRKHRNGWWWYFGTRKHGRYMIHEHDLYLREYICDYDE